MAEYIPPGAARDTDGTVPVPQEPAGTPAGQPATDTPARLRTFCRGILHAIGMFDPAVMTEDEKKEDPAEYRTWFSAGETCMAALLAANIAVPAFFWFAGITALPLAFIASVVLFLPLFVFLPKLIRYAVNADTDAVLEAFGKNEQTKKVFWALFVALAGLVLAEVLDPAAAQAVLEILGGT
jgi:hypothetical protein